MRINLDGPLVIPPGVTLYGADTPPNIDEVRLGSLWLDDMGDLYRLTIGERCETCGRPGSLLWTPVEGGLETLRGTFTFTGRLDTREER